MNRSQEKGTKWETRIVDYLISCGWPHAERRRLGGAHDRGDIAGLPGVVIEAKNTNRQALAQWLDEAEVEASNDRSSGTDAATIGVAWAHRVGKASPAEGYVIMSGATFVQLLKAAGW